VDHVQYEKLMPFPPEAFIIGAQRSGTTSLSSLLGQHPGIVLSVPKEPDFFSVNWNNGLDWYRGRFRRHDATLIDASVNYTMVANSGGSRQLPDTVPQRIYELSPKAKFVYLVRDPGERCHSAYWHEVRASRESRSLRQAVEQSAYYVMASYYHRQITTFLHYFPLDRFFIIRFDEFARDPLGTARACSSFFDARPADFSFQPEQPRNQAFLYSRFGQFLRDIMGQKRLETLSGIASRSLPGGLHPYAKRLVSRGVPELSSSDRAWLTEWFAEDAAAFARLTGVEVQNAPVASPRRLLVDPAV
jgi:sulfotransferase family protein